MRILHLPCHKHLNHLFVGGDSFKFRLLGRAFNAPANASWGRNALLNKTHLSSEGRVGNPASRFARCDFLQHLVDLFKGETLSLGDQEVGEEHRDDAERAPHEEDLGGEVRVLCVDEVGSNDGNDLLRCC